MGGEDLERDFSREKPESIQTTANPFAAIQYTENWWLH
jgi:hypothetical protein